MPWRRFVAASNCELPHTDPQSPVFTKTLSKGLVGRAMRDWIDQLRFIERVTIVVSVFVIVILEIADIGFAELGKAIFENAGSASW